MHRKDSDLDTVGARLQSLIANAAAAPPEEIRAVLAALGGFPDPTDELGVPIDNPDADSLLAETQSRRAPPRAAAARMATMFLIGFSLACIADLVAHAITGWS